jgi:hypothetical protein
MNATEHLVELYYRFHKRCFTIADVKIPQGNSRQLDLLAYGLKPARAYHVEVSVTPLARYQPTPAALVAEFRRKFLIRPQTRMDAAYQVLNLNPERVQRVFCCWQNPDAAAMNAASQAFANEAGFQVELLSFRDEVLPRLHEFVGTPHYEDDLLRTLSLLKQRQLQLDLAQA